MRIVRVGSGCLGLLRGIEGAASMSRCIKLLWSLGLAYGKRGDTVEWEGYPI